MDPLISAEALMEAQGAPDLKILDASWRLDGTDMRGASEAAHIPGAQFFDIDAVCDSSSSLPHMLPWPEVFAAAVGAMGISESDHIVVYDDGGFHSAPRVWWMFRVFGAARVQVLDGGLAAWQAAGGALEAGFRTPAPAIFQAGFRPELVADYDATLWAVEDKAAQIVDARPADRFRGEAPEPRPGLASGHMPGARSLPLGLLYAADGKMKSEAELRAVFATARVDAGRLTITTCGSGVAASAVALALARIGNPGAAVYDGSWSDWGGREGAPVARGEAEEEPT